MVEMAAFILGMLSGGFLALEVIALCRKLDKKKSGDKHVE